MTDEQAAILERARATVQRLRGLETDIQNREEMDTGRAPVSERESTEDAAWGSTTLLGAGGAHFDPCKIGLGGRIVSPAPEPAPQRRLDTDLVGTLEERLRNERAYMLDLLAELIAQEREETHKAVRGALKALGDQAALLESMATKLDELGKLGKPTKATPAPAPEPKGEPVEPVAARPRVLN